jgi:hypothetical protein
MKKTFLVIIWHLAAYNLFSQQYGGDFSAPYNLIYKRVKENQTKWGIADYANNKIVVPCEYSYIFPDVIWDKLIPVNIGGTVSKYAERTVFGGKYGFIDISGKKITNIQYDWFDKCVVAVETKQEKGYGETEFVTVYGGKWSAIDSNGKEIILFGLYTYIHAQKIEGENKYFFYANKGGKWKKDSNDGYYRVFGGTWHVLDENGKLLQNLESYMQVLYAPSSNFYITKKSGESGYYDYKTKSIKWLR